jgi:hypothetical protein
MMKARSSFMTSKKHPKQHLVVQQTGHRVVSHDMQGNMLHATPWTVTSSFKPMIMAHDEVPTTDMEEEMQSMTTAEKKPNATNTTA